MPRKIFLIRHGQTDDNVNKVIQGWRDVRLNQQGILQAQKLAKRFQETIDVIYSSDLMRAMQTAEPLSQKLKLPIIKTPHLREHNLGIFEGWKWDGLEEEKHILWQQFWAARDDLNLNWKKHNGESFHEFLVRVKNFFEDLKKEHANKSVALVTHGGTINRLLEALKLKKITDGFVETHNTSITVLTKTRTRYKVIVQNDTSHLIQE